MIRAEAQIDVLHYPAAGLPRNNDLVINHGPFISTDEGEPAVRSDNLTTAVVTITALVSL
jgi:hypothetical protein